MDLSLTESSDNRLSIFTDGSVNGRSKVGYGAYLLISDLGATVDSYKDSVMVKRFEQTSSTKLELQILLWMLKEYFTLFEGENTTLVIYTDSQNIISLQGRREHLEKNNYYSRKNQQLKNHELYREFYQLTSELKCEFVKVVGHQPSSRKDKIHQIFSLVDKSARQEMRADM